MGEFIGWLGGSLLAICGLPQAIKSYKEGHSRGIDNAFIWMWMIGEILCLLYVSLWIKPLSLPLVANYIFNILIISVIVKYKYFPVDRS